MSGPPPMPPEQRRRLGNPQKRPLPSIEETGTIAPAVNGSMPEPLRPLGLAGRDTWDKILTAGAVWIAGTDLHLLQQICEQLDEQQALRVKVLDPAPRRDQWRDRRGLRMIDDQILKGMTALGLSPAARARLGLAQVVAEKIHEETTAKRERHRGKMFNDEGIVEAKTVEPEPEPEPPRLRKSWTKAKIVLWHDENDVDYQESWTKKELLEAAGVKP